MNRNIPLLIILIMCCIIAEAQQIPPAGMSKRQAALINELKQSGEDAGKVRLLLALADIHWTDVRNLDSVVTYAGQARTVSRALKFDSGYNDASLRLCRVYVIRLQFTAANKLVAEATKDQQVRLLIAIGEGYLYRRSLQKTDLDTAYQYFSQALQISKVLGSQQWKRESLLALGKYYFSNNEPAKAKGAFMELIADYQRLGNQLEEARIWATLGGNFPDTDSTFKEAMEAHENARRLYHAVKDTNNERSTLEDIAAINMFHANFALAKKQFIEAIHLRRLTGSRNLYKDFRAIAFLSHATGDLDEALSYGLEAEKNIRELDLRFDLFTNIILGMVYSDDGQAPKGLQYLLAAKTVNDRWTYFVCRKVVEQYIVLGEPGKALAYVQGFEKTYPAGRPADKETLAGVKGDCYAALNNTSLAEKYYLDMIRLDDEAQKQKAREVEGVPFAISGSEAYHKIANFYTGQHKYITAAAYLDRALQNNSFSGNQFYTANLMRKIWGLKFKVDSATGNHLEAIRSYERYTALNDSIFTATKSRQFQQLQVRYETEQKEKDILARDEQIKGLTQIDKLRLTNLQQTTLIKNITLAAVVILLVLGALLYRQYVQKQRANQLITTQNAQLQHLLAEKEWLLKEVHHRVKNNLHTIICLLQSQAVFLQDDALKAIENSQHRVYAMSLIHQKLYQADNIKTIDMAQYLPEFIQYLKDSFGLSYHIVVELDIHPLLLDVARAIPIALILNEAVTNSIKYAFPENRKGLIKVTVHKKGKEALLVIADNGIGIRQNIEEEVLNSFGVELMKGLTDDINGQIAIENDQGTKISVAFNLDPLSVNNSPWNLPEKAALAQSL